MPVGKLSVHLSPLWREVSLVEEICGDAASASPPHSPSPPPSPPHFHPLIFFCSFSFLNPLSLSFLLLILLFILPLSVPSTISMDTVQVEASNIITWQPPTEPNGVIRYYNIRISRHNGTGGEGSVQVVQGVTGTRYDFSMLGLNAGTYMIQVG